MYSVVWFDHSTIIPSVHLSKFNRLSEAWKFIETHTDSCIYHNPSGLWDYFSSLFVSKVKHII